jgi:hypothetical protein
MIKENLSKVLVGAAMIAGLGAGVAGIASAQTAATTSTTPAAVSTSAVTTTSTTATTAAKPQGHRPIGQDGVITAINGTTITMAEESDEGGASYTVNTSSATITKDGAASTLTSFAVGDKIFVDGTISGTSVTATSVSNGHGGGHGGDNGADGIPEASEVHTGTTTQ